MTERKNVSLLSQKALVYIHRKEELFLDLMDYNQMDLLELLDMNFIHTPEQFDELVIFLDEKREIYG